MKKSSLGLSSILLTLSFFCCQTHECPQPRRTPTVPVEHVVVLQDEDISDVNCNSYYSSLNRGGDGRLQTAAWTFSGNFGTSRTFFNFNLSSIPQDALILSAVLTLYADTTNYISTAPAITGHSGLSGSNSWKIKRITSDWAEHSITWATRPTYDNTGAISMDASTSYDQSYVVDIADMIRDQVQNPLLYYGIMLQLDTETPYRVVSFCSKEHPYAATLKPTLKITYKK